MIRKSYPWLLLLAGIGAGLFLSGRIRLHAQDRGKGELSDSSGVPRVAGTEDPPGAARREAPGTQAISRPAAGLATAGSIQDVLLRPYRFPFTQPTSLAQLCVHLKQTLNVPVVLDLAALGRQDLVPDDTVQLELDGVRLKTGLKLILDQVGLTYRVVAEDNLLIITDLEGSDDPLDRVWSELRALHRDLHDVQDAVQEIGDSLVDEKEEGPRMRKPTIIEEMPDAAAPSRGEAPSGPENRGRPEKKPDDPETPVPAPRTTPSRVPL